MLPAATPWAAKWDVVTGLTVEETYSDNIALSSPETASGEWVTVITPRATVNAKGDRFVFDADYRPELQWYANEGASRALHIYDAGGTAEFVKRTLFVEARSTQTSCGLSSSAAEFGRAISCPRRPFSRR